MGINVRALRDRRILAPDISLQRPNIDITLDVQFIARHWIWLCAQQDM